METNKPLKLDRLDAHDRLESIKTQSDSISLACQKIIDSRPFGDVPFYIFAHKRELGNDERCDLWLSGKYATLQDVPSARLIWQPRLTKPQAQENSMLFKAYPGTDMVKVIWMIPDRALWPSYEKGKLTENETIVNSIHTFQHDRKKLELPEDDDLTEEVMDRIYKEESRRAREKWTRATKS